MYENLSVTVTIYARKFISDSNTLCTKDIGFYYNFTISSSKKEIYFLGMTVQNISLHFHDPYRSKRREFYKKNIFVYNKRYLR